MTETPDLAARIAAIEDRLAVQDAVDELFVATDLKAWDRVRAIFAAEVDFDMTSLAGGAPARLTPAAIADAWAEGLGPVQAVHHQTGNHVVSVSGDEATATCYGTATHYRPDQQKKVTHFVGTYHLHLVRGRDGWRIDGFRFASKYVD